MRGGGRGERKRTKELRCNPSVTALEDDTIIAMDNKLLRARLPSGVRSLQRASRRERKSRGWSGVVDDNDGGGGESPIATCDSAQSQGNRNE